MKTFLLKEKKGKGKNASLGCLRSKGREERGILRREKIFGDVPAREEKGKKKGANLSSKGGLSTSACNAFLLTRKRKKRPVPSKTRRSATKREKKKRDLDIKQTFWHTPVRLGVGQRIRKGGKKKSHYKNRGGGGKGEGDPEKMESR